MQFLFEDELAVFESLEKDIDDRLGRVLVATAPPPLSDALAAFRAGDRETALELLRSGAESDDPAMLDHAWAVTATVVEQLDPSEAAEFEELLSSLPKRSADEDRTDSEYVNLEEED